MCIAGSRLFGQPSNYGRVWLIGQYSMSGADVNLNKLYVKITCAELCSDLIAGVRSQPKAGDECRLDQRYGNVWVTRVNFISYTYSMAANL